MSVFVAVVVRKDGSRSRRDDNAWAAFTSEDQDGAILRALEAVEAWGHQYKVLVGELFTEVVPNRAYQLKSLRGEAEDEEF